MASSKVGLKLNIGLNRACASNSNPQSSFMNKYSRVACVKIRTWGNNPLSTVSTIGDIAIEMDPQLMCDSFNIYNAFETANFTRIQVSYAI